MDPFEEDDDAWPAEPDEFDPDSLGPQVDIPEAPDPSQGDVPAELFRAFWATVVMVNIGLFGTSLGLMFIAFRGQYRLGGGTFAIGVLALLFAYRHYRNYQNR